MKIENLLNYVKKSVPFYQGLELNEKLENWPIISKREIKKDYSNFISDELINKSKIVSIINSTITLDNYIIEKQLDKDIILEYTSGSSGVPFRCIKSVSERNALAINMWRRRWDIDANINTKNFLPLIHTGIRGGEYDFRDYSESNIIALYKNIKERNILSLHTTPNMIRNHITKSNIDPKIFNNCVNYLEFTGNYLQEDDLLLFRKIFNATCLNLYGLIEVWGIAYSCKEGHLHVIDKNNILELIDEEGKSIKDFGIMGEVVVTSLYQRIMPFIRYRTGDFAEFSNDRCEYCNTPIIILQKRKNKVLHKMGNNQIDGEGLTKRVLRKIQWKHDFPDLDFVYLEQRDTQFTFFLNPICDNKMFEKLATDILVYELKQEVVLGFQYISSSQYEMQNLKGYLFKNIE